MPEPRLPQFLTTPILPPRWKAAARSASVDLLHLLGLAALVLLVVEYGFRLESLLREALDRTADVVLAVAALVELVRWVTALDPRAHGRHNRGHLMLATAILVREAQRQDLVAFGALDALLPLGLTRWLLLAGVAALEVWALGARLVRGGAASRSPARAQSTRPLAGMLLAFPGAALWGAFLLWMPESRAPGAPPIRFVDAFFTAASAVCVTGLTVVETGTAFSPRGQAVIAALFQMGGLGIATFAGFFAILLGRGAEPSERATLGEMLQSRAMGGVGRLIGFIVGSAVAIEVAAALWLMDAWRGPGGAFLARFGYSLFHTVSAFCNAGFGLEAGSLAAYRSSPRVMVTIGALIVIGGIGFPVLYELWQRLGQARGALRRRLRPRPFLVPTGPRLPGLSLQSRLALCVSAALLVVGTAGFWLADRLAGASGTGMSAGDALFLSVTARTAGFATFDLARLPGTVLFLLMGLMFIGASPGSTGGGIKTTTYAVLLATVRAMWRNRPVVDLFRRTIPAQLVRSAFVILSVSFAVVFAVTLLLMAASPRLGFRDLLFEAVSAFGTVGLSTGITPRLEASGKLVLCAAMFLGRLGPLSIMVLVGQRRRPLTFRFAEEPLAVG